MGLATTSVEQTWRRHADLAEVASPGRSAILRLTSPELPPVILEDSAAVIWQLIDGPVTHGDLAAAVAETYGQPVGQVDGAVAEFLDGLTATGLLVRQTTASLQLSVLGVPVHVNIGGSEGAALAEQLGEAWANCLADESSEEPAATISVAVDDPAELMATLEWATQQITTDAVSIRAGELLMFHAGAVADPATGASVVLVGPSGMGKTTLAAALGRHWGYVTDETAAIDDTGRLCRYPKPLSVIEPGHDSKVQRSPRSLGLLDAPDELQVRAVLLLDRRNREAGAGAPPSNTETGLVVEAVPNVPAIAMLAEHTSYLGRLEQPLNRIANLLNATGGLRIVRYSTTDDLIPFIAELLGDPAVGEHA